MKFDLSILHLVIQASLLVQLVMVLLLAASVISWTMIVAKWRVLKEARQATHQFEEQFWSGTDLGSLYDQLRRQGSLAGLEHIFVSGFKEYIRLARGSRSPATSTAETSQRAMRVALTREADALESYLPMLATIGSVSPYVGLFGTVWGIMHAFRALGEMQQATLALVAPGIAEALVATAMGLFAAIPAVIAYNRYTDDVARLLNRYDNFMEEFTVLLERQALLREAE